MICSVFTVLIELEFDCFRFIDEDRLNGRCELTDLETKFSQFSTWDTSISPLFNIYIKHSYCPEPRFLLEHISVTSSAGDQEPDAYQSRILTSTSPFIGNNDVMLDLFPLTLSPPTSNIFPQLTNDIATKKQGE